MEWNGNLEIIRHPSESGIKLEFEVDFGLAFLSLSASFLSSSVSFSKLSAPASLEVIICTILLLAVVQAMCCPRFMRHHLYHAFAG